MSLHIFSLNLCYAAMYISWTNGVHFLRLVFFVYLTQPSGRFNFLTHCGLLLLLTTKVFSAWVPQALAQTNEVTLPLPTLKPGADVSRREAMDLRGREYHSTLVLSEL